MTRCALSRVFALHKCLVGDILASQTGRDLQIARWSDVRLRRSHSLSKSGLLYRYSTIATFDMFLVGTAEVYWRGEESRWDDFTTQRMNRTLGQVGHVVKPTSHDRTDGVLHRRILARGPTWNMCIVERLLLPVIGSILGDPSIMGEYPVIAPIVKLGPLGASNSTEKSIEPSS